jgi:hypothetical protein
MPWNATIPGGIGRRAAGRKDKDCRSGDQRSIRKRAGRMPAILKYNFLYYELNRLTPGLLNNRTDEHSNDEYRSAGTEYPIANTEYPMSKLIQFRWILEIECWILGVQTLKFLNL